MQNFLMTSFGEMLMLIQVEKSALFSKHKPGKKSTNETHAVLHTGTGTLCLRGKRSVVLRVTRIQLFSSHSAPTSVPGKQFHLHNPVLLSPQPVKGASFSPTASILEAQRGQAACPHHTACEKHSRTSPRVTPSPLLPTSPGATKVPPAKTKNEIFLFLRHIWKGGQTSSYLSTRQEVLPLSPAAVSYISHSEGT